MTGGILCHNYLHLKMCGRKTLTKGKIEIIKDLSIRIWDDSIEYEPSYNIAPTAMVPVMLYDKQRIVKLMQWGLIPKWAKDLKSLPIFINARAETVAEKPAFGDLVATQRCVVISDGYYEWRRTESGKLPYYIKKPDHAILPMAGLWSEWFGSDGQPKHTYTVITTAASEHLVYVHHRMPVILDSENLNTWLDNNRPVEEALSLLKPFEKKMLAYPVSAFVNNVRNNSPQCIEKAAEPPSTLFN